MELSAATLDDHGLFSLATDIPGSIKVIVCLWLNCMVKHTLSHVSFVDSLNQFWSVAHFHIWQWF